MREAWNAQQANPAATDKAGDWLEDQLVILTVPASFDEVARELTITAAKEAGIARAILLEEPLAAFLNAWLAHHETDWQGRMRDGELILVCDVGGGTTDFTVIGGAGATGLRFDRFAVGDHLLLGGDNMDLALGRLLEAELLGQPGKLDTQRWRQLVYQCRKAKETLLDAQRTQDHIDITVMGAGGQLFAGTLKGSLSQAAVERVILDGFFPVVPLDANPQDARRSGLTELGLPYAQDPAVTRHLAAFWRRFAGIISMKKAGDRRSTRTTCYSMGCVGASSLRNRLPAL